MNFKIHIMNEREFPEAPMLMQMLGLFGDVELGPIRESDNPKSYLRSVILNNHNIGTLVYERARQKIGYEGRLPCLTTTSLILKKLFHVNHEDVYLSYDLSKKKREDRFRDVLFS